MRTGRKHVLSILVENKPGVLTRIAGLFARRGFNIDTLTVGPTDDEHALADHADGRRGAAPDRPGHQAAAQAGQRPEDPRPRARRTRSRASWRCSRSPPTAPQRAEVMQICEIFRGKVVDVTRRSIIVEITGTTDKIEAFERMVRPFGLIEMMRTGEIAISRGRGETELRALAVRPHDGFTAPSNNGTTPSSRTGFIFDWQRGVLDRWLEEDEEVGGHPRDPYSRVDALPSSRHVVVSLDGVVLGDTTKPVLLFETGLPTRYYLPREDVNLDVLTPTSNQPPAPTRESRTSTGRHATIPTARTSPGPTRIRCRPWGGSRT